MAASGIVLVAVVVGASAASMAAGLLLPGPWNLLGFLGIPLVIFCLVLGVAFASGARKHRRRAQRLAGTPCPNCRAPLTAEALDVARACDPQQLAQLPRAEVAALALSLPDCRCPGCGAPFTIVESGDALTLTPWTADSAQARLRDLTGR